MKRNEKTKKHKIYIQNNTNLNERTNELISNENTKKLWQKLGWCHEWYMATRKESDKGCKSVRWIEIATSYTWIGRQNKGKPRFKAILTIIAFDVHFECLSCIRWNNAFCAKVVHCVRRKATNIFMNLILFARTDQMDSILMEMFVYSFLSLSVFRFFSLLSSFSYQIELGCRMHCHYEQYAWTAVPWNRREFRIYNEWYQYNNAVFAAHCDTNVDCNGPWKSDGWESGGHYACHISQHGKMPLWCLC